MRNFAETLGTLFGIIGAFAAALNYGSIGYPCFFLSSVLLLITAFINKQRNFIALQGVFMLANVIGLKTFLG